MEANELVPLGSCLKTLYLRNITNQICHEAFESQYQLKAINKGGEFLLRKKTNH